MQCSFKEEAVKDLMSSTPKFIFINVGPHWVKCGRQYGRNYVMLDKEGFIRDSVENVHCVVCGKKATEKYCLPRDI